MKRASAWLGWATIGGCSSTLLRLTAGALVALGRPARLALRLNRASVLSWSACLAAVPAAPAMSPEKKDWRPSGSGGVRGPSWPDVAPGNNTTGGPAPRTPPIPHSPVGSHLAVSLAQYGLAAWGTNAGGMASAGGPAGSRSSTLRRRAARRPAASEIPSPGGPPASVQGLAPKRLIGFRRVRALTALLPREPAVPLLLWEGAARACTPRLLSLR